MRNMPLDTQAPSFADLQKAAASRHAWPTAREEGWQFTRLNAIRQRDFTPASKHRLPNATSPTPPKPNQLQFINGVMQANGKLATGITIGDAATATAALSLLTDATSDGGSEPIADFALAHADTARVIKVGGKVDTPLTLSFQYSDDELSSHGVIVFDVAANAGLTILEEHTGGGNGMTAPLMLFRLAAGSSITHSRRLLEGAERAHLGLTLIQLADNARYHAHSLLLGGQLARTETRIRMDGEAGDALLNTIYMARDKQMHDITSRIDHNAPHCLSFQRVHGIISGEAKSVFQGKVRVARGAQKTDGNQMSRALLLSRTCEVSTKPELEIYADDVACSHGATLGELDEGQLFYLKSRGIPHATARQMLIVAFLEEVMEAIEDEAARAWLSNVLDGDAIAAWCAAADGMGE